MDEGTEPGELPARVKLTIFSEEGAFLLELGAHVIAESPLFAAKIGELAAEWAHAEAEMSALLAVLMDTAAERTFALMAVYRSASSTADAARGLAKATLKGAQRAEVEVLITRFKTLSDARNEVQHGLWARKANSECLFRLKALEYTQFMVKLPRAQHPVQLAIAFSATMDDAYTVERLATISDEIRKVAADIFLAKNDFIKAGFVDRGLRELGFGGASDRFD